MAQRLAHEKLRAQRAEYLVGVVGHGRPQSLKVVIYSTGRQPPELNVIVACALAERQGHAPPAGLEAPLQRPRQDELLRATADDPHVLRQPGAILAADDQT